MACHLRTVTDPGNLQLLLKADTDPLDHIGHQGSDQTMKGSLHPSVGRPGYLDRPVSQNNIDSLRYFQGKLSLGTLNHNHGLFASDLYTSRNGHG